MEASVHVVEGDYTRDRLIELVFESLWPDEDWESVHLRHTPTRFVRMLQETTTPEAFEFTTFETNSDEMVIVQNIPFHTFCAHHVLPFQGAAHVAYIPDKKLCGLSKLARIVKFYSAGLNVQEELTNNIAEAIEIHLQPLGVGVVMEAEHLCMSIRGVQVPGTTTITSAMKGVFLDTTKDARPEFLQLISKGK